MTTLLVSLAFGAFVGLLCWQAWTLFRGVPIENRQFLDRPPWGFRLVWPLIEVLVFHAGHLVPETRRSATARRLKRAGVEYSVSALQFEAAKVIAGAASGLLAWLALASVGQSGTGVGAGLALALGGYFYPDLWLREIGEARRSALLRALPFYLDIITLSLEAGSNLTGGITQAVRKSADSPLRRELGRVLRDIRAGRTRAEALRDLADRTGSAPMRNLVGSLIQAERTGASLGPLLRAQAEQLRSERFQRAEKKAMEAPVKLLAPLVTCIFPATFLVLGFLVLSKLLQQGVLTWAPLVRAYHWPGL